MWRPTLRRLLFILMGIMLCSALWESWISAIIWNIGAVRLSQKELSGVGNYDAILNWFKISRDIASFEGRSSPLLGIVYYQNGWAEKAISELSKGSESNANELSIYWLGQIYWLLGQPKNALHAWSSTRYIDASLKLARRLVVDGKYLKAKDQYEYLQAIDPNRPDIQFEYGKLLWNNFYSEKASSSSQAYIVKEKIDTAFKKAVKIDPYNPMYLTWLGWYEFKINNDSMKALSYLTFAAKYAVVKDAWLYYRIGQVYESIDDYSLSLDAYQQAFDTYNGNNLAISKSLAKALFRTGKVDDAIKKMKTVVNMEPKSSENHFLLALYYSKVCAIKEAKKQIDLAIPLDLSNKYLDLKERTLANLSNCK